MVVFKVRINTLGSLSLNIFGDANGVVNVVLLAFKQERYWRKRGGGSRKGWSRKKAEMVKEKGWKVLWIPLFFYFLYFSSSGTMYPLDLRFLPVLVRLRALCRRGESPCILSLLPTPPYSAPSLSVLVEIKKKIVGLLPALLEAALIKPCAGRGLDGHQPLKGLLCPAGERLR